MDLLSRISYVIVSLILIVLAGAATVVLRWGMAGEIGTLVLAALLLSYWVGARRGALTPADPEKRLRRARGGPRPVAVHFYSDFHVGTLLRRPAESGLENRFKGSIDFIHISAFHPQAPAIMESLKAGVGDWVLFDRQGRQVGEAGGLTPDRVSSVL
jgi:hypothetical protein